jgi:serine/threonine protein kinase, bacterial
VRPVGSKYLLEEPLGRGATGTVWRARVRDAAGGGEAGGDAAASEAPTLAGGPGRTVAVKVLKEELAGDPDVVMRFLRERSALLRLNHPNIVRVRDLVVEGDLLALVMDLVDGPDLHRHLREHGPFTPVAAALLTAGIADALAASHADEIVHRDLKPANVLLATHTGEDGAERMHPMLTDFGIARLADSPGVTRTHEFVGTPAYVAPESAQGRPQTSAVDIYGAGILLYELVTGRTPFHGGSAMEMLQAHLTQDPRRPGNMPEPLWTVVERCLRKEPAERPSAESLARALRVVAAGVGVHATPAQAEAALGVAALLAPDEAPTPVPGSADPTQVLPSRQGGYGQYDRNDPNAATTMLPAGGDGSGDRGADGTRVLPPVPEGPGGTPQGPHPWESQLNAARHRNEQTEATYLPPEMDPLFRRPRREPGPQAQGRQQGQGGYGYPQQQQYAPQQYQPRPPQQPYDPRRQPQPQQQYYEPQHRPQPPQAPHQPEPPAGRERRRGANPVKIPGLGCLKGCLVVILVLVAVFVLAWYTTPLPDWFNTTRNLWDAASDWAKSAWHLLSKINGSDNGSGSPVPTDTPKIPDGIKDAGKGLIDN